ncbi:hypothetical protein AMTRI_Chr04g184950 [Amborella trichopoda]|uniref:Annexin n=1 Tax=Amborella trichopoda TaxID=13333 RepID=W1NL18_AMBTC|nr:annexin D1 [Amborella trichopoda]ERM95915.1 hypothetical protein AMTR_s00060p00176150 [Amborella trichopoda]|eukprot:XP_006828499.1 annexin D1 [Amborella trichopoda]
MSSVVVPESVPSPADDCEQLRVAFAGWGTNEKLIISILGHRTATQRQLIRKTYFELYGEDLLKSLDSELSGDFERALLLWTLDPAERDALMANQALRRWNPEDRVLIEIACARSSEELFFIRRAYHARFKRSFEEDVAQHTTGDFRKLLVPLVSSYRYDGPEVNMHMAKLEAKTMKDVINDKAFNHEELIRILSTRSKAQLNATLNNYKDEFGMQINNDLKGDPEEKFQSAVRAVVKCITKPQNYFEKTLRLAIVKLGTDEVALTRVVVTRADVDMKDIKVEYHKRNSTPLDRAIASDTSGDYKNLLLTLIGHGDI